jgi:hypothetical protein
MEQNEPFKFICLKLIDNVPANLPDGTFVLRSDDPDQTEKQIKKWIKNKPPE